MKAFFKELLIVVVGAICFAAIAYFACPAHAAEPDSKLYAVRMEQAYNLPPGLLRALIEQESRWRNVAGRHGEIGLAQIKPSTVAMICPECVGNSARKFFTLGSRGDDVARIQVVLAREGLYAAYADGIYGPATDKAVRAYQSRQRIAADGVVGPQTWGKLFGALDPYPGKTIVESLWNPTENIEWAARILAWLRDNVSADPAVMLAAYNGGAGHPVVRYMVGVQARMERL